jgi:outer membrane lipoprotein carrier protein
VRLPALLVVAIASRLAAQDSSTTLVDRAVRTYRSARTVHATFEQALTSPATGTVYASRGEYFQGVESRFAIRFADPAGDAIVNDGVALWLYLPSSAKGQVVKLPSSASAGFDVLANLLTAPKSGYLATRVRDEAVDAHSTSVFALVPKTPDMPFTRATLWIGKRDALVWQLEAVEQSGLVRRVRFTSVRTGGVLPEGVFVFSVPAGVKVVDQAALFGQKP